MALVSVSPFALIPLQTSFVGASSALTIDAATEKGAWIFQCPRAGVINGIDFAWRTVTQAPASGIKISFQNVVATTGLPDDVVTHFRTVTGITANTWATSGLITSDGTDTGTKRTVTRGEWLVVVFEFAAWAAGDNLVVPNGSSSGSFGAPYMAWNTGSWAKRVEQPNGVLVYADGTVGLGHTCWPNYNNGSGVISSSTTPDEAALKFQVSHPCRMSGAILRGNLNAGNQDVILYSAAGTVLATVSLDKDFAGSASGMQLVFDVDVDLDADVDYYLSLKPTTTTSASYSWIDVSAGMMTYMPLTLIKDTACLVTRTDGGAWTPTSTRLPLFTPIVSALSLGGGGVSAARTFNRL